MLRPFKKKRTKLSRPHREEAFDILTICRQAAQSSRKTGHPESLLYIVQHYDIMKTLEVCQTLSPSWGWGLGTRLARGRWMGNYFTICSGLIVYIMGYSS